MAALEQRVLQVEVHADEPLGALSLEQLGADVADDETNDCAGCRLDPDPARNQRRPRTARRRFHDVHPHRRAAGRRHAQTVHQRVAVPGGPSGGQRMERPSPGEAVAEDPQRVVRAARDKPRTVEKAGEVPGRIAGTEAPPDHVHPKIVGLTPGDDRLLLLDRRCGKARPAAAAERRGEPVANARPVIGDVGIAGPMPSHRALHERTGGGIGEWFCGVWLRKRTDEEY